MPAAFEASNSSLSSPTQVIKLEAVGVELMLVYVHAVCGVEVVAP